jgi:hypothetical protein
MGEERRDKERDQGGSNCWAWRVLYLRILPLIGAQYLIKTSRRNASHASCDQTEEEQGA